MKPVELPSRQRTKYRDSRGDPMAIPIDREHNPGQFIDGEVLHTWKEPVLPHTGITSPNLFPVNKQDCPCPIDANFKLNYAWTAAKSKGRTHPLRWVAWNNSRNLHEFIYNEELQLRVIKRLGDLLPAVKSFRSNDFDCLSDSPISNSYRIPKKVEYPKTPISLDINKIKEHQLWKLYTEDKVLSISMQHFIIHANELTLKKIANLTFPMIHSLITHHFGNYCLQKIIMRDEAFRRETEQYCLGHLKSLVFNEYSSRTMQTLVENSDSFRRSFLNFAAGDTRSISKRISYVFLVTSAINCSKTEEEMLPLLNDLASNSDRWFGKKYMKRVIVSLIQKCSHQSLNLIFQLFTQKADFTDHFCDRYRVYILVAFIKRDFKQIFIELKSSLSDNLELLLEGSYFKLFCDIIFRGRIQFVLNLIFQSLIGSNLYKSGHWRSSSLNGKFAYLLALTSSPREFGLLGEIWKDLRVL